MECGMVFLLPFDDCLWGALRQVRVLGLLEDTRYTANPCHGPRGILELVRQECTATPFLLKQGVWRIRPPTRKIQKVP